MTELQKKLAQVRCQKASDAYDAKVEEEMADVLDVVTATTKAARDEQISYDMRAHALECLCGDGSKAAIQRWMPSGGGCVQSKGNIREYSVERQGAKYSFDPR